MKLKRFSLIALCAALVLTSALFTLPSAIPVVRADCPQTFGGPWQGFYWNNQSFSGNPTISRNDPAINFNWQLGSPDPAIPADHFTVRWQSTPTFDAGTYVFSAGADDGIRVALDGNLIINRFTDANNGFAIANATVGVGAGQHTIIVDYYDNTGNAGVQFYWQNAACLPTAVPATGAAGSNAIPSPTIPPGVESLPISGIHAVVIADLANVRSGPSTRSTAIAEVKLNDDFHVIANNGSNTWFLVSLHDGRRGWLYRRVIYLYNGDWTKLPVSTEYINAPAPLVDVQGVAAIGLIVRDAPTKRGGAIGAVNEGQFFKILQLSTNSAWVYINADGLLGWVYVPDVKVVFGVLGRLPRSNTVAPSSTNN